MKTGMLAAEAIYDNFKKNDEVTSEELVDYETSVRGSWVAQELKESRNFKGGFDKGLWFGMAHGGLLAHVTKGREPWTLAHRKRDSETTEEKSKHKPIEYPKPDGKLTFDLLTNLQRSGTNHDHDQPSHLVIKEGMDTVPSYVSLSKYAGPE